MDPDKAKQNNKAKGANVFSAISILSGVIEHDRLREGKDASGFIKLLDDQRNVVFTTQGVILGVSRGDNRAWVTLNTGTLAFTYHTTGRMKGKWWTEFTPANGGGTFVIPQFVESIRAGGFKGGVSI